MQQTNTKRGEPWHPMRPIKAAGDRSFAVPASSVAPVMVPDPYSDGGFILAMRSVRDDLLASLHSHRQIDDHQFAAGRLYQRDVEVSEQGLRAIEPTKEKVDGGLPPELLSDRQQDARKSRTGAETAMGLALAPIAYAVLINGLSYSAIVLQEGGQYVRCGVGNYDDVLESQDKFTNKRARDMYGRRAVDNIGVLFRSALDCLVIYYGMSTRTRH